MIYSMKRLKKVKNHGLILLFVDFQYQWNKSIGGKVHLYLFLNRWKKMKMKQAFYFSTFQLSFTFNDLNVYVRLRVTWEKYDPKWHL